MTWDQLRAILDDRRSELAIEADELPVECPYDGAPLDLVEREDGSAWLHCPMGNYTVEV